MPAHADPLITILAENERLVVLEHELMIGFGFLLRERAERPIIENVAILQDFDERRAAVLEGPADQVLQMFGLDVDAAGDEGAVGTESDRHRVERMIGRAEWRRFGDLAQLRSR